MVEIVKRDEPKALVMALLMKFFCNHWIHEIRRLQGLLSFSSLIDLI